MGSYEIESKSRIMRFKGLKLQYSNSRASPHSSLLTETNSNLNWKEGCGSLTSARPTSQRTQLPHRLKSLYLHNNSKLSCRWGVNPVKVWDFKRIWATTLTTKLGLRVKFIKTCRFRWVVWLQVKNEIWLHSSSKLWKLWAIYKQILRSRLAHSPTTRYLRFKEINSRVPMATHGSSPCDRRQNCSNIHESLIRTLLW